MHKNVGVGKLLVTAALREHHRVLDNAIKLEDWSRAEALFVQAIILTPPLGLSRSAYCRPYNRLSQTSLHLKPVAVLRSVE